MKKNNLIPIYILLFIILVILVMGFFKQEVAITALLTMPQDVSVYKNIDHPCKKTIVNPVYADEMEKANKKCAQEAVNNLFQAKFGQNPKSCYESEYAKFKGIEEYVQVDSTCTRKIEETWFYALGINWFKKGEKVIGDSQK